MNLLTLILKYILSFAFVLSGYYSEPKELPAHVKQHEVLHNKTFKEGIETVLIHKKGWELSFPIIDLNNEEEKIHLSFDELGNEINDYSWQIIHCNMDWSQSGLEPIEYLSGFFDGDIQNYNQSQNTLVNYINYSIDFPNDDVAFQLSGNYILKIFEQNHPSRTILMRRFYVIDSKVRIKGNIFKQPVQTVSNNQRVNFTLNYDNEILDAYSSLISTVVKNNGAIISTSNISPSKVGINELGYENIQKLSFPGGNEFRHFDIKSLKILEDILYSQ